MILTLLLTLIGCGGLQTPHATDLHTLEIARIALPEGASDCLQRGVGEGHRIPNGFLVPDRQHASYAACIGTRHDLVIAMIGTSPSADLRGWIDQQLLLERDPGAATWTTATLSSQHAEEEVRPITFNDPGTRRTRYVKLPGTIYLASVFGPDTAEATALLDAVQFDDFAH